MADCFRSVCTEGCTYIHMRIHINQHTNTPARMNFGWFFGRKLVIRYRLKLSRPFGVCHGGVVRLEMG